MAGMTQYLSFCVRLISLSVTASRFTHVEHVSGSPSFLRLNSVLLCVETALCLSSVCPRTLGLLPPSGHCELGGVNGAVQVVL